MIIYSKVAFFVVSGFEHFHSNINPEELFRTIFGQAGFRMQGFGNDDFEESNFGFGPASEVSVDQVTFMYNKLSFAVLLAHGLLFVMSC